MDLSSFIHEPKGVFSYALDQNTLHIRIKTKKGDISGVTLLAVDPFNWKPSAADPNLYEFAVDSMQHVEMKKDYVTRLHDCWFAEVTDLIWRRVKYGFVLDDGSRKCFAGCHDFIALEDEWAPPADHTNYFNYPYILEEDLYRSPAWVKDTVWYQIFPDRFNRGAGAEKYGAPDWGSDEPDGDAITFGGDLQGVMEKLDYIQSLGCDGLYFTPVFTSPSSHKYDASDYFRIDPHFGDNESLGKLVEEAHNRGIRVMLDAVFNHCGYEHPFWQDVLKNGQSSPYFDYFYILDPEKPAAPELPGALAEGNYFGEQLNYRTFAFAENMPKWNTGHPAAREYLLSIAVYWTERYHIDGWRLDVANEVSHDFWREFRKRIKSINQDIYILGENWFNSSPWLLGDQFDAVMNYEFTAPVTRFFGMDLQNQERYSASDFVFAINQLLVSYPKHVTANMFNLLDSHDTARILTICGDQPEPVKLAYVFLFTYAGSPSIYYGGEVGMRGDQHHNRQCMLWNREEQNLELFDTIRRLVELRKQYSAFRETDIHWLLADEENNTLLYKKESRENTLYVVLHNSPKAAEIELPEELKGRVVLDLMEQRSFAAMPVIGMGPYSYRLLLCGKAAH